MKLEGKYIIEYGNKRGTWSQVIIPSRKLAIEVAANYIHTACDTIEAGWTVKNEENNKDSAFWKFKKGETRKIWQNDFCFCAVSKLPNDLGPAVSNLW